MGAVNFSLDVRLIECLKRILPLNVFIETGTFHGDTIAGVLPYFDQLVTIELSDVLWKSASERFELTNKVQLLHGDSRDLLPSLSAAVCNQSIVYWLDAHWCVAENTSGEQSQCPLLNEIHSIAHLNHHSILLIDDARLFLTIPPEPHDINHWPLFDDILKALSNLSQYHKLMVINDVIVFYPKVVHNVLQDYSRRYGIDWLRASQSLGENEVLRASLENKERVIQEQILTETLKNEEITSLQASLGEKELLRASLENKERVIQEHRLTETLKNDEITSLQLSLAEKDKAIQEHAAAHTLTLAGGEFLRLTLMKRDKTIQDQATIHELLVAENQSLKDSLLENEKFVIEQTAAYAVIHNENASLKLSLSKLEKEKINLEQTAAHLLTCTEKSSLQESLREKEQFIEEQSKAYSLVCAEKTALFTLCEEKEKVIQNLIAPRVHKYYKRLKSIFRPRLGNLNQYAPRPLSCLKQKVLHATHPQPLISIVTPSFMQGDYIEKTLISVLDQAYPNFEYFIQDGGSTDHTIAVLEKYEDRLSGWTSEHDGGQSQAINKGLSKTTGDIMAWLNSDDLLLPGALASVVDYFNRHPNIDVVYGNRLLINSKDEEIGRWILPGHNDTALSWADYIPQETLFWRRSIWEKVGGHIDETYRFAMDWDLLIRFRDAGAKFGHIPRFLGAFRIHELQKTSAEIYEIGFKEMNRIRERGLGRIPSRKEIHKALLPFLLKHIVVDMMYRVKTRLKRRV